MNAAASTFRERLLGHAARHPDAPALVTPSASVSYGALPGAVRALALELRERGAARVGLVALTARAEIDHVLAMLALMELAVPQVGLASRDPAEMRARLARRVGASAVLADRPADAVGGLDWIDLGAALASSRARPGGASLPEADPAAAALYFTGSGTTGEPKVLRYSQRQLALHAENHVDFASERVLRPAHVEYNNSKRMRLYVLWQGGTCLLADGAPGSMRSLCESLRATWLELSPIHGNDLLSACRAEGPLPAYTSVRVGGARVPIALRRAIMAEASPRLHVSYGTTETSIVALAGPAMHDELESVGPPVAGVDVDVVRADGSCAAPGEIGEIRLRAPGMANGYVGDAAATARHFRAGWFMPGDLASLDDRGLLFLHGRKDDMMIMNSINIFPAEIERTLESHPAVEAAAAFPLPSAIHGQIPVAAVELREGHGCTPAELVAYARTALGVRAPRRVAVVASLPRNPQGKIVKRELAARLTRREAES